MRLSRLQWVVLGIVVLGIAIASLIPPDYTLTRKRIEEVIRVLDAARLEAQAHYLAKGAFRVDVRDATQTGSRRVRSLRSEADGRLVAEIAIPELREVDGKSVVYQAEVGVASVVAWRCYVPEGRLAYFPLNCRFRSAAEAPPVP